MRQLSHDVLRLVEVDPIGLVYVPATLTVHHVAELFCVLRIFSLFTYYILGQLHLVRVPLLIVSYDKFGSWAERGLRLKEAILYDVLRIDILLLPLLVLGRSEE